jgi:two-component system response regulator RegA
MTHSRSPGYILLADATPSAEALSASISRHGYTVHSVDNFDDALATLRRSPPRVLVTEVRLGARSGLDLLVEVRRNHAETQVVVATAYPCIASAQTAIRLGAVDYLTKPIRPRELLQIIGESAEQEEPDADLRAARRYYIDLIVSLCGSKAQAARVLGLDRRSLRRMLAHPNLAPDSVCRRSK